MELSLLRIREQGWARAASTSGFFQIPALKCLTSIRFTCMQGEELGFQEFFWELQPWQGLPFHRQRCCRKSSPKLLALLLLGTRDPRGLHRSQQILRSLQLCPAGAFPASKQACLEIHCSDNRHGHKRDLSSVGQGSSRWPCGKKHCVMASFESAL